MAVIADSATLWGQTSWSAHCAGQTRRSAPTAGRIRDHRHLNNDHPFPQPSIGQRRLKPRWSFTGSSRASRSLRPGSAGLLEVRFGTAVAAELVAAVPEETGVANLKRLLEAAKEVASPDEFRAKLA